MILEASGLTKRFHGGRLEAVRRVSFSIQQGETVGVLGASGSGKSTLAKILLGLMAPDSGSVYFNGRDVRCFHPAERKEFRRKVQVVFQHPLNSLDPRMKVKETLREPFEIHGVGQKSSVDAQIYELLRSVELSEDFLERYPRQMSGGQCQRVAIARALSLKPELLVCDEPVSALDGVVQIQILNLFLKLQRERNMSYLFISHDLRVIRHMSDRVLVMNEGQLCESGTCDEVFHSPKHPYTRALIEKFA